jgi:hypothetical protein
MSKLSYIIVPVAAEETKINIKKTIDENRGIGYWTCPQGGMGDKTMIGDQIWFVNGKNEQAFTENAVRYIGNITQIVDPIKDGDLHQSLSMSWEGDWSNRKIAIFRLLPILKKDLLTYDQVCELFNYTRLPMGSTRVVQKD